MRRWLVVLAGLGVVAVVAVIAWAQLAQPVAFGFSGGAGPGPGLRTTERPDDTHLTAYTYEEQPGATFAVQVSLQNDGPLPITILGTGDPTEERLRHGFWREDFTFGPSGAPTGDATGPAMTSIELEPGQGIDLWARYRIASACLDGFVPRAAGTTISTDVLQVDWQLLGISRHTHVPMPFSVGTRNDGPGQIPCPAAAPSAPSAQE